MQVHKYYSTYIYSVGRASRVLLEGRTRATRASVEEEREVLCEVAFASELCEETRLDLFPHELHIFRVFPACLYAAELCI